MRMLSVRAVRFVRIGGVVIAMILGSTGAPLRANAENQLDQIIGVVSQPFNVVSSGTGRFALKVSPAVAVARGARVEFLLHRRVAGRDPFRAIAGGTVEAGVIDSVSLVLARVARDNTGLLAAQVPIRTEGSTRSSLTIQFDGVYPLTVRITNPEGDVLASTMTFLNRRDPANQVEPVRTSTLVRISSTPSFTKDGLTEISDLTRDVVRRATSFLAAAPGNVTVAVEPELVAALASTVEPGDEQLFLALREQLRRRSVVAATFARIDPSAMAARGLDKVFVEQVEFGKAVLDRFLPGVPIRRSTWLALDPLDNRGVRLLRDAGIRFVILANGAQTGLASGRPIDVLSAVRARGAEAMPVVATDPLLSDAASEAATYPQQAGYRIAAEAIAVRDDLLTAGTPPDRIRLVLSTKTGAIFDNSALLAATKALASAPGFASVDMSEPEDATDTDPEVVLRTASKPYVDRFTTSLAGLRSQMIAVSSMLPSDDSQRDTWRYLFGLAASSSKESPTDYIAALRSSLRATLDAISVTTPDSINLSSRNGTIRFQVRNNTDEELTVRVRVSSVKFKIEKPTTRVTLVPGGTTDVTFEGTTLTNGRFPISIRVQTPEGNLDVVPLATITARVSAVAGFGQLASVTLLLLLLAWWWSHRRSRRASYGEGPAEGTVGSQ